MSSGRGLVASIAVLCACAACAAPASRDAAPLPQQAAAPAAPPTQTPVSSRPGPDAMTMSRPSGNLIDHPVPLADADLPPLPAVAFVPPQPMEVVRAVFVFAATHPEVLSHIPCFCRCQDMGHQNNDDCFVKRRDGRDRPVAWEAHGMG